MKNINPGNGKLVFTVLTIAIGCVVYQFNRVDNIMDIVSFIQKIISVEAIVFVVFYRWAWKLKGLENWLVTCPNLNGTWLGQIESTWVNPDTKKTLGPINIMITIKQNLFNINCVMQTNEMKSYSFLEGFSINNNKQVKTVAYLYSSEPRINISKKSPKHDGAAVLDVITLPDKKLTGKYWTDRSTIGEISLSFYRKKLLQQLPKDFP